jgi:hypothetical protein
MEEICDIVRKRRCSELSLVTSSLMANEENPQIVRIMLSLNLLAH